MKGDFQIIMTLYSPTTSWQLSPHDEQLLQLALNEDLGLPFLDITTQTLFGQDDFLATARIISKHDAPFVLSGLPVVQKILSHFADSITLETSFRDGDLVQRGATVLTLEGSIKTLMMAERLMLNFLQHLSAIATQTNTFVELVKHTKLKILDTRKTIPGMSHLAKYAVFCGGGVNHRVGLYDAILIKDNHIDALGGIAAVLNRLPDAKKYQTVIEIRTRDELEMVLASGLNKVNRVLLDNMDLSELKTCVELCANKIATEASGNVTLASIVAIAETGVDYVSIGKLTHSVASIDLSMLLI